MIKAKGEKQGIRYDADLIVGFSNFIIKVDEVTEVNGEIAIISMC